MDEEEVISTVRKAIRRARSRGMTDDQILQAAQSKGYSTSPKDNTDDVTDSLSERLCSTMNCLLFKVYPIVFLLLLTAYPLSRMAMGYSCLLTEVSPFGEAVTPVVDCSICEGVTSAPRLTNLTRDDFVRNHAYTSRPILVVGAALNWSAVEVFSYDFFKGLYMTSPGSLDEDNDKGQFFPYSSDIRDLKELFSLPSEVATMETEKWYIGW